MVAPTNKHGWRHLRKSIAGSWDASSNQSINVSSQLMAVELLRLSFLFSIVPAELALPVTNVAVELVQISLMEGSDSKDHMPIF